MKFACKLQYRQWQEGVELPWERPVDILQSVYQTPDGPLPDISSLCTWFRRELLGPAAAHRCQIEDIEAKLTGDDAVELEFLYTVDDTVHEYDTQKRRMMVAL